MNYQTHLKTFTTDAFTENGSATTFTLSEIPANSSQIMVFIDGILQNRLQTIQSIHQLE